MTISAADSQISYAGNGITTAFAVPFPFDTAADIKILSTDSNGNVTIMVTGFTITGGGGSSMGTVTFTTAPAAGVTITILDNPLFTQPTDYVSGDAFLAESHERALDRVTRIAKRLEQKIQRCARTDDGDLAAGPFMLFPTVAARRGKFAMWADSSIAKLEPAVGLPIGTPLSQSIIGALLHPQTAAESAAGVTPVNYWYEPGNVRRYGADATGVASSTTAFNSAIAANDEVYVPPGTYLLAALSTITTSKLIYGAGKVSKLLFNTTGHGIAFNVSTVHPGQSSSFTVRDLAFDNITSTPASFIRGGSSAQGSVNGLIERCYFSECAATYCIDNYIGYGTKIRSCIFNDITGSAIRIQDSLNQSDGYSFLTSIEGCDITRPSVHGILVEGAQSLRVSSTVIEGCGAGGIVAQPLTNQAQAWNIHLDNVYFEANTGADIDFSNCNANYWAHAVLTACTFVSSPSIQLGSRSEIQINSSHCGGSDVCSINGSVNAFVVLINCANFQQVGTFRWVEIGGTNSTQNNTVQQSFAPTWGADAVVPAIGNGTLVGYYTRIGNQVFIDLELTMGTTTTYGTGDWFFSGLPFTCNANIGAVGAAELRDDSAKANYAAVARITKNTTSVRVLADTTQGSGVDSAQPFTWASGDVLRFSLVYNVG